MSGERPGQSGHRAVGSARPVLVWSLVVGCLTAPGVRLPAQSDLREAVSVQTDAEVTRQLLNAEQHLVDRQWLSAVEVLRRVVEESADKLVRVAPGRYVRAGYYARSLLCRLPPEGRKVYRRLVDSEAQAWLQAGLANRDATLLQRVVDRAFASSSGDDALWHLGHWAWEVGEVDQARAAWSLLQPLPGDFPFERVGPVARYPDSSFEPAQVQARLVLCDALEGALERAEAELAALRRLHADASGTLAGQRGRLVELLEQTLRRLRQAGSDEGRLNDWPTFGGNVARNGRAAALPDVGRVLWTRRLRPALYGELPYGVAGHRTRLPVRFPVVWNDAVLLPDAFSVLGFQLKTGQPLWNAEQGRLYAVPWADAGQPIQPVVGTGLYTATVRNGRLYARMGPPVTLQASGEFRARSEIIGLDLARGEGRLCWRVTADQFVPPTAGWSFEGLPVVLGRRLYVPVVRSHPNPSAHVACFDLSSRKLVWIRRVCTSLRTSERRWNRTGHAVLTAGHGLLFYASELGAVAALEPSDGRVRWVVTYFPKVRRSNWPQPPTLAEGLTACVYAGGWLCVAPRNSDTLLVLDADSGTVLHEVPVPSPTQHLLGVIGYTLVGSGRGLWGVDVRTGRFRWRVRFDDPAGWSFGRGVVAGRHVFWPTREEILVVDAETGSLVRRIDVRRRYGLSGGNLLVAGGHLVLATPESLVVFDQFGRLPTAPRRSP